MQLTTFWLLEPLNIMQIPATGVVSVDVMYCGPDSRSCDKLWGCAPCMSIAQRPTAWKDADMCCCMEPGGVHGSNRSPWFCLLSGLSLDCINFREPEGKPLFVPVIITDWPDLLLGGCALAAEAIQKKITPPEILLRRSRARGQRIPKT